MGVLDNTRLPQPTITLPHCRSSMASKTKLERRTGNSSQSSSHLCSRRGWQPSMGSRRTWRPPGEQVFEHLGLLEREKDLDPESSLSFPCRFLSASSSEGVLGNVLLPEVTVPWSRGVREERVGPKSRCNPVCASVHLSVHLPHRA